MKIEILYFAQLRETLNRDKDIIDLPEGAVVSDVVSWVLEQPGTKHLRANSFMKAVNEEFCKDTHKLACNDRVAILPPVSGG